MLWLPNRGVRHQLKFKEAAQLGGFFVFETKQTRQLDETRWGQTSLYSTRGQTSSRLDSEVNKGADFFEVKLRSDSKMGGQRWGGQTPTPQDEGQGLRGITKTGFRAETNKSKV